MLEVILIIIAIVLQFVLIRFLAKDIAIKNLIEEEKFGAFSTEELNLLKTALVLDKTIAGDDIKTRDRLLWALTRETDKRFLKSVYEK